MIRGTTPTLIFTLPFDAQRLAEGFITMTQNGALVIEKALLECICDECNLCLALTQRDTLALQAETPVNVQLRARTTEGDVVASEIYTIDVSRILKDGEI